MKRLSADFQNPYDNSLRSLKNVYPEFVPQNREDYPSAVDEDDFDANIEVLPIQTILYSQGPPSAEGFNIFDDETNFDRCCAVLCRPKESAVRCFIYDEDLFGRLNSDPDHFNQHGGDHRREDLEGELSEEDMLFGSGWDSDETLTDAQIYLDIRRERVHTEAELEEIVDVALQDTVPAEGDTKYFDADDLFEREEEEMLVFGRDGWYSEDWDL